MSVGRCMREHTHRQFLAFLHHLDAERDHPDVTHHYLMQIAREVRGRGGNLRDFTITFPRRKTAATPRTVDEASAASKDGWVAAMGPDVRIVRRPASERPTSHDGD